MPGGRPTLWTPEVKQKILSSIANGNFNYIAAQSTGVPSQLVYATPDESTGYL